MTPDKPKILTQDEFIEFIENLPEEKFNMRKIIPECGTPGCVAGWAYYLLGSEIEDYLDPRMNNIETALGYFFPKASQEGIEALCYPGYIDPEDHVGFNSNTKQAAQALRNLRDHGKPKWHEIVKPVEGVEAC